MLTCILWEFFSPPVLRNSTKLMIWIGGNSSTFGLWESILEDCSIQEMANIITLIFVIIKRTIEGQEWQWICILRHHTLAWGELNGEIGRELGHRLADHCLGLGSSCVGCTYTEQVTSILWAGYFSALSEGEIIPALLSLKGYMKIYWGYRCTRAV